MGKRIFSFAAAMAAVLLGASLKAQGPAISAPQQCRSLWVRSDWVRLEVVQGRLAVQANRCGQGKIVLEPASPSEPHQVLTVLVQPASMLVSYELNNGPRHLRLDVDEEKRLLITGSTGQAESEVKFIQPASGKVTLQIGGDTGKKYVAGSFWHLLLNEPEVCRSHLLPVLTELRPDWRLAEQLTELEDALVAQAGFDVGAQRAKWQVHVDDLTSECFAERQAAYHALREAGQPLLGFLKSLDWQALDPEQRRRLRDLKAELSDGSPDSPERVASWLVADKCVWLAMLSRGDRERRALVVDHLAVLYGKTLHFDPQATDAQLQAQVTELRAKLAED